MGRELRWDLAVMGEVELGAIVVDVGRELSGERATLGSGGDGEVELGAIVVDVGRELSGERATLGSGGDGGGRTGSNCGGCGERAKWGESYVGIWW